MHTSRKCCEEENETIFVVVFSKVSLCNFDWLGTCCVDQAGHRDLLVSLLWVLRLKVCVPHSPPPSLSIHLFLKGRHTIATPQAELWKASYRVGSADKVECIFKVQPPVTLLNGRQACHITLRLLHNHKADSCLARIHSGPSTEHSFLNHESPSRR